MTRSPLALRHSWQIYRVIGMTSATVSGSVEDDRIFALSSFGHDHARSRAGSCETLEVLECGHRNDHSCG